MLKLCPINAEIKMDLTFNLHTQAHEQPIIIK